MWSSELRLFLFCNDIEKTLPLRLTKYFRFAKQLCNEALNVKENSQAFRGGKNTKYDIKWRTHERGGGVVMPLLAESFRDDISCYKWWHTVYIRRDSHFKQIRNWTIVQQNGYSVQRGKRPLSGVLLLELLEAFKIASKCVICITKWRSILKFLPETF